MKMAEIKSWLDLAVAVSSIRSCSMDLTGFSTVGTQTPTEDRTFEFPECFSPSPTSHSSVSSIGTQTDLRRRLSFEYPDSYPKPHRPRLFRRHSTGSDVYNFSTSPTLLTAFGASFQNKGRFNGRHAIPDVVHSSRKLIENDDDGFAVNNPHSFEESHEEVESVGTQLRRIGDDLDDKGKTFRSRSLSLSRFLVDTRRRTSSLSS